MSESDEDSRLKGLLSYDEVNKIVAPLLNDKSHKLHDVTLALLGGSPTSVQDLKYVKEEMVTEQLGVLRAARFIDELRQMCASKTGGRSELTQPQQQQQQPQARPNVQGQAARAKRRYEFVYEFPVEQKKRKIIPDELEKVLHEGVLSKRQRCQLNAVLGAEAKKQQPPNTPMSIFVQELTLQVVAAYPAIKDSFDGVALADGNGLLYSGVYTWVENSNRSSDTDNSNKRRKRHRSSKVPKLPNAGRELNHGDKIIQENTRQVLWDTFQRSPSQWNLAEIRRGIQESYDLQVDVIENALAPGSNNTSVTEELYRKFPFLFHPVGASAHFNVGANLSASERVDNFMANNLTTLRYFILAEGNRAASKIDFEVQAAIKGLRGGDVRPLNVLGILKLLAHHLNEDMSQIVIVKEDYSHELPEPGQLASPEAQEEWKLPETPCFVGSERKSLMECNSFHIFVDTIRVTKTPLSLLQCVKTNIPLHFMLNIAYNPAVKKTLEFIQRVFIRFDADTDSGPVTKQMTKYDEFTRFLKGSK